MITIDNRKIAYVYGYIFGKGGIYWEGGSYRLQIHIIGDEKIDNVGTYISEVLNRTIKRHSRNNIDKHYYSPNRKDFYYIRTRSKDVINALDYYGMCPGVARDDIRPRNIPLEYERDFIRGIWDACGYIRRRHITGGLELCDYVMDALRRHIDHDMELCLTALKVKTRMHIKYRQDAIRVFRWLYLNVRGRLFLSDNVDDIDTYYKEWRDG